MSLSDLETVAATIAVEKLMTGCWRDIDFNGAHGVTTFFTEDCTYDAGPYSFKGRAGLNQFYDIARAAKVGVVTRHFLSNLHVSIVDKNTASVDFFVKSYSYKGTPPIDGLTGPALISDCHVDCRREADGTWLIAAFKGTPTFISANSLLHKMAKPS